MVAPQLDSYDFATEVDLEALFTSLKCTGGVILKNVASKDDLAQLELDVRPHIEADKAWTGSFFPAQTRCVRSSGSRSSRKADLPAIGSRVTGLVSKSRTFVDKVIMNPVYQATAAKFLTSYHTAHLGSEFVECVSKPQLMNTSASFLMIVESVQAELCIVPVVFAIAPGKGDARNQPLHRKSFEALLFWSCI